MNRLLFALTPLITFWLLGCAPPSPKTPVALSQAQEHFLKLCAEELKYECFVYPTGRSMWVYVPIKSGIIDLRAAPKDQTPKAPSKEGWAVSFLESEFVDGTFVLQYDIGRATRYDQKTTYQNKYSQEYSQKQREVLTAITRSYFDVGARRVDVPLTVGDDSVTVGSPKLADEMASNPMINRNEETPPEFFVLVFADPQRGVAIKSISYFDDMKKALSNPPALSQDEYMKRYVYEMFGDEALIDDLTGARLTTDEIRLGDFLAKQIAHRIRFQFTQSDFPPSEEPRAAIRDIVSETLKGYEFTDFERVRLIDLKLNDETVIDRSAL